MAELNTEAARTAARTALGYSQAFDGKGIDWQNYQPWPHRIELAQALDWITELGAMVLNLADRADSAGELHTAVCQAVALLNRAPEVARCAEGREARDTLRQVLVQYADAYMDQMAPAPEREAIAAKHRNVWPGA